MELTNFDLASMAGDGAELEIYHPKFLVPLKDVINSETKKAYDPIFIKVLGHDSKEYVQAIREEAKIVGDIDPLESQQRIFAAMVCGWSGITEKGKPFEYSKENAIHMLEK